MVITFFVARKMGSVEPKSTLQEAFFKAQKMMLGEMETPSWSRDFGSKCARASAAKPQPRIVYDRSSIKETGRCRNASARHRHLQRAPRSAQSRPHSWSPEPQGRLHNHRRRRFACVALWKVRCLPTIYPRVELFFGSWRSGSRLFSLAFTPSSYSLITPGLISAWFGRASVQLFFSLNCVAPGRSWPGGLIWKHDLAPNLNSKLCGKLALDALRSPMMFMRWLIRSSKNLEIRHAIHSWVKLCSPGSWRWHRIGNRQAPMWYFNMILAGENGILWAQLGMACFLGLRVNEQARAPEIKWEKVLCLC